MLEALIGKQTAFARTPKYRVESKKDKVRSQQVPQAPRAGCRGSNWPIGGYFAATVCYAIANENYITVPFLILFVLGYWYTGLMSLLQGRFERYFSGRELREPQTGKPYPVGV